MEETLALIIHGCNLARHLESNLTHFSTQPNIVLLNSCDAIVRTFKSAMDRLNSNNNNNPLSSYPDTLLFRELMDPQPSDLDAMVQELLRSGYSRTMDLLPSQFPTDKNPGAIEPMEIPATTSGVKKLELGGKDIKNLQMLEGSESGKSPVTQRSRKRKNGAEKHTVRVAAPRIGNTEIPPEDGFTWRKYGQKDILGSMFPRGYYRCTHKNFYGCNARKQVQRLDQDPNTFEVTYYGDHTCHISSTVPSIIPAMSADMEKEKLKSQSQSPPFFASISVPMDLEAMTAGKDTNNPIDLADAMFNTGSSSNSINSIFPPNQDK